MNSLDDVLDAIYAGRVREYVNLNIELKRSWKQENGKKLSFLANKNVERAIKEGIENAVAHAAYFDGYGEIMLEIHPNRIVISNLCLPESSHFANKWFSRSHKTVNNLLMEGMRGG